MVYAPRAFELGAIAESDERFTEQVFKALEGEGFDAQFVGERFVHHITNTFNFNLPTAIVPFAEVGFNYNFFTGGPVDNTSGLREDRTKSTTSYVAKGASALFSPLGMTPIQADHFIRGYTAWAGTTVAGAVDGFADRVLGVSGADPEPLDYLFDTPVLKEFFKEIDGKSSNFFVEEFYKRREPAREIEGSLRTVPEGDTERTEELHKLAEDTGVELFSDISGTMSEIRKALKENKADRTISGEERERVRKELINERNELAREVFEEIKSVGEEEEESDSSDSSLLNLIGIGDAHADETKATGGSGKYIDLSPEPLTQKELHGKKGKGHVFYGADAVAKVEEFEGELPLAARRVVELEGFVDVPYKDQKGVVTAGVGQTGDFIHQSFMDSFEDHVDRAEDKIPKLRKLPEALQAELIQAEYRGDLGQSPTFVKLFNNGQYKQAAKEFLANDEYKGHVAERDGGGDTSGIIARMEAVSKAVNDYADNSGTTYIVKKGDTLFKVAKKYNLSVPELKKRNNIKDVTKIRVGTKLKV
jgi:LysM repeat protein